MTWDDLQLPSLEAAEARLYRCTKNMPGGYAFESGPLLGVIFFELRKKRSNVRVSRFEMGGGKLGVLYGYPFLLDELGIAPPAVIHASIILEGLRPDFERVAGNPWHGRRWHASRQW